MPAGQPGQRCSRRAGLGRGVAAALSLGLALVLPAADVCRAESPLPELSNTGLAVVGPTVSSGDWVAFSVNEAAQGADLDGDGDTADFVLHVLRLSTGETRNLGLARGGPLVISGDWLVFGVSEAAQDDTDLNGDGDTSDVVYFLYRFSTGAIQPLGLASGFFAALDGDFLFFVVDEAAQGADLNGDGDLSDDVYFVRQLSSGQTANLGLAASHGGSPVEMTAGWVTFSVGEAEQGQTDLNGDGDSEDSVVFVHDFSTGVTRDVGLESEISLVAMDDAWLAFLVTEDKQGHTDLNGDGDVTDFVLHVYQRSTGTVTNLRTDVADWTLDGDWIGFQASEEGQGESDLNGDGDTLDYVLEVRNLSTGETRNLGLATRSIADLHGDFFPFSVDEAGQGATDLNRDRDALDGVLHVYRISRDSVSNTRLATDGSPFVVDGDWMAFGVPEFDQGDRDLNGDGDSADDVAYVRRLSTGRTTNLHLASSGFPMALQNGWLALTVPEDRQGDGDLNGDGDVDAFDRVPFVRKLSNGQTFRIPLAASGGLQWDAGRLIFSVSEMQQGAADLNGDGDALDDVLHVASFADSGPGACRAASPMARCRRGGALRRER